MARRAAPLERLRVVQSQLIRVWLPAGLPDDTRESLEEAPTQDSVNSQKCGTRAHAYLEVGEPLTYYCQLTQDVAIASQVLKVGGVDKTIACLPAYG